MSITQTRSARENVLANVSSGSGAVLGSISVLLAIGVTAALALPHGLVLPAIALAATLLCFATGAAALLGSGHFRENALTCTGIFALVGIAASMLGDPDHVALFLK